MKHSKSKRKISWEWYGVKLLNEIVISGEPSPDTIDEDYNDNLKTFEESIIVVKAQSYEHAYKIAEQKAKASEASYYNPYSQRVEWKLVQAIDCFILSDDEIKTGTEVYSRLIEVPKEVNTEMVINRLFPREDWCRQCAIKNCQGGKIERI